MQQADIIPHLFRTEYRKIVSVLCRRFGVGHIEMAEDIASDTFLTASQVWALHGVPPNAVAWLYRVAQNKAHNYIRRQRLFETKIDPELRHSQPVATDADIDLSPQNISDSQLRMMFAICHPSIPPESQIGLSLRILCGFGIEEIANAFLTNRETINKRLFRAREKLREEKISIEIPAEPEIRKRLDTVLTTIYLLFSEGYYSESDNTVIRKDLCFEAIRLCRMLIENQSTDTPEANALLSLMCFHASRFDARIDKNGEPVLYDDQDTSLWDADLISQGAYFLNGSARGNHLSRYHLEAAIAYWNTQKEDTPEKWEQILQLYNQLLQVEYSPIAALNRTYALARANSKQEAIAEAEKLKLHNNHYYYMLLGELYSDTNAMLAGEHFTKALSMAKTAYDKKTIRLKLDKLK